MTPRAEYRTSDIPTKPGVYLYRDRLGTVIYVGKAKNLRRRLASYFQPSRERQADPRIRSLINSIAFYELMVVRTDEEALLLESRLIKQYCPRFNVLLRDDKRFLLIKIDTSVPYPRLSFARVRKDDGCLYFGPYPIAGAVRETVDYLTRHFGLRTCSPRLPTETDYKHCKDDIIRFCTAPCVGKISPEEYQARLQQVIDVVEGKTTRDVIAEAEAKMKDYAAKHQFERAARLRDIIQNLRSVFAAQNRTFSRRTPRTYPGEPGVNQLQEVLDLPIPPRVMECFDNSNLLGSQAVSSMVCFVDGKPDKSQYRRFHIKTVDGIDDFASMVEIVTRRYQRLLEEEQRLPDLVVIDGGRGQLNAAYNALEELGLEEMPIIGLAKRYEEIIVRDRPDPIRLDRHTPGLRLLQAIRDEAHRFAITFHQKLRRKRILNSMLDEIPGVGSKRKQQILDAFGSVRTLRKHDAAELARRVPGIGDKLATQIMQHIERNSTSREEAS